MLVHFAFLLLHKPVGVEVEVVGSAGERHIEQVEVIHALRLRLLLIRRLVVRTFHRLFPWDRHLFQPLHIALRLHASLAPQIRVLRIVHHCPVAEGDEQRLALQALRGVDRHDTHGVAVRRGDGVGVHHIRPILQERLPVGSLGSDIVHQLVHEAVEICEVIAQEHALLVAEQQAHDGLHLLVERQVVGRCKPLLQVRFRRMILRQVQVHIAARDVLRGVGRQKRIDNHLHRLRLVNMKTVGGDNTHLLVPIHLRVVEIHHLLRFGVLAHQYHNVRCAFALVKQLANGSEHICQYILPYPLRLQGLFGKRYWGRRRLACGSCRLFLRGSALRIHPQAHHAAIVLSIVELGEVFSSVLTTDH